jgi:riboflavin synthase alpha subunit
MLKDLKPGSRVNLEADMLARYADRLLNLRSVNEQDKD